MTEYTSKLGSQFSNVLDFYIHIPTFSDTFSNVD